MADTQSVERHVHKTIFKSDRSFCVLSDITETPYNLLILLKKHYLCLTFFHRGLRSGSTTEQKVWRNSIMFSVTRQKFNPGPVKDEFLTTRQTTTVLCSTTLSWYVVCVCVLEVQRNLYFMYIVFCFALLRNFCHYNAVLANIFFFSSALDDFLQL